MNKTAFLKVAFLAVLISSAHASPVPMRATITGTGGDGRCTIELTVDHSAEVEIYGDQGLLTTTAGRPATWRLFQCNAPLPQRPVDFRFVRVSGRGAMRLIQNPYSTGGRAVVQIKDSGSGRGNYIFELQWRAPGRGGWQPRPQPPSPAPPPPSWPGPGRGWGPGGFPTAKAIRNCQDAVSDRLNGDGYQNVVFESTIPPDNPARTDWITGTATGKRGLFSARFAFTCSVDFLTGTVRSADLRRR